MSLNIIFLKPSRSDYFTPQKQEENNFGAKLNKLVDNYSYLLLYQSLSFSLNKGHTFRIIWHPITVHLVPLVIFIDLCHFSYQGGSFHFFPCL